eukprot:jgi/Ulvmu1/1778/UM118_0018.1
MPSLAYLLGATAALACMGGLLHVRADLDDYCQSASESLISILSFDYGDYLGIAITDGCELAGTQEICDVQAVGGPCSAEPACVPFMTGGAPGPLDAGACTGVDAVLCCSKWVSKACDTCEPEVLGCTESCSTPVAPRFSSAAGAAWRRMSCVVAAAAGCAVAAAAAAL